MGVPGLFGGWGSRNCMTLGVTCGGASLLKENGCNSSNLWYDDFDALKHLCIK
jgi:hypothetical protein